MSASGNHTEVNMVQAAITRVREALKRHLAHPEPAQPEPKSKQDLILSLLARSDGAGLNELTEATGWQPHPVRSFLSKRVPKRIGCPVLRFKGPDGRRRYRVIKGATS